MAEHRTLTLAPALDDQLSPLAVLTNPLAEVVRTEDAAEDSGWLDPMDRLTCSVHERWVHECAHSKLHVNVLSGHRWCRPCRRELEVAVDELTATVTVHCPRCERGATTRADHHLIAACEASLTAARAARTPQRLAA